MGFWSRLFGRKKKPKPHPAPVPQPVPVPNPAPAPTPPLPVTRSLIVDAYSFCGHARERLEYGKVPGSQCPAPRPWDAIQTNDRKFAITTEGMAPGTYDESDPAAMAQILKWMEDGPDSLSHQIEVSWPHMSLEGVRTPSWATDFPGAPFMMSHFADFHAKADTPLKFSIAFWQRIVSSDDSAIYWLDLREHGWTASTMREALRTFARWVAELMKSLNHLEVDGKSMLTLGYAGTLNLYQTLVPPVPGVDISPPAIVQLLRNEVRAITGKELYLMATATAPAWINPADESVFSPDERMFLREWDFDGFAPYLLHGRGWDDAMGIYKYWRDRDLRAAKVAGLAYWAAITAGYDGAAWKTPESELGFTHMPTPAQFQEHVRETIVWAKANGLRGVRIYARGEGKGEGGDIEPMADVEGNLHRGDEMLRALRAGLQ